MKTDILFIGALEYPQIPKDGEGIKNRFLMDYFRKHFDKVSYVDTKKWRRNPLILLKLVYNLLFVQIDSIIVSVSNPSAYKIFKVLNKMHLKSKIYYWMIGGYTPIKILKGIFKPEPFRCIDKIIVEADKVGDFYKEAGFDNVIRVYNFKPFNYVPDVAIPHDGKVKFFFLSRIDELKGVDHIFDCVREMNSMGYQDRYIVDLYGRIEIDEKEFMRNVNDLSNVEYKGFLDLRNEDNYKLLSQYDAMLFPTRHLTEGFPGAIADAAISGVPVIASNWNYAEELIGDNVCGLLFPMGDKDALREKMINAIDHRDVLQNMRSSCVAKAQSYKIENVLTTELLYKIGLKQ